MCRCSNESPTGIQPKKEKEDVAFAGVDCSEEKKTRFIFRGKPIILSKTRGTTYKGRSVMGKGGWYPEQKKEEALAIYAVTGSLKQVEELTSVSKTHLKKWLKEPWALSILEEIRSENDLALEGKFSGLVNKALEEMQDRLENGDVVLLKSGETARKPVPAKELNNIIKTHRDQQSLLQGKPTSRSESVSDKSRLERLEQFFLSTAGKRSLRTPETIDAEVIEIKENVSAPA